MTNNTQEPGYRQPEAVASLQSFKEDEPGKRFPLVRAAAALERSKGDGTLVCSRWSKARPNAQLLAKCFVEYIRRYNFLNWRNCRLATNRPNHAVHPFVD